MIRLSIPTLDGTDDGLSPVRPGELVMVGPRGNVYLLTRDLTLVNVATGCFYNSQHMKEANRGCDYTTRAEVRSMLRTTNSKIRFLGFLQVDRAGI